VLHSLGALGDSRQVFSGLGSTGTRSRDLLIPQPERSHCFVRYFLRRSAGLGDKWGGGGGGEEEEEARALLSQ
jgi:hypothetical protein